MGSGSRPNVGNGPRNGPGIMTSPSQLPSGGVGQRPNVGTGQRPNVGAGQRPNVGQLPSTGPKTGLPGNKGVGQRPVDPGFGVRPGTPGAGNRPSTLPGLGLAAAGGYLGAKGIEGLGRRQEHVQDRMQNVNDRSDNLQDRMQGRQDIRESALDNRQDRQDLRNDRREDWQNWRDDYYGHHHGWYHGAWGDHWSHMWEDHTAAMIFGTTMWGLNRMGYWFGTSDYANPYYTEPLVVDNTTIYYSEPLAAPPVTSAEAAPASAPASQLPPGVTSEGLKHFDTARGAFYAGQYPEALAATNKALATMPKDAAIHEFRALTLFALGNYRDAAMTLHPVLSVGPGWDWTTLSSLYPSIDVYTTQLRALETITAANPKAPELCFLLGYHYLTCGHQESAVKQFKQAQKVLPSDALTAQLLKTLGTSGAGEAPPKDSTVKIDPSLLHGTWTSARGGKATFELTLGKDKSFTWIYRGGKTPQEVKSAYAVDGNVLAMEPDAGGVMLAEITAPQNGGFDFRTLDTPKSDPGLKFQRK